MESGAVYDLPLRRRHLAVDERGVGLRATWHVARGFVNLSLWADSRCVQTFHLTPVEAGRLIGFLAGVLADAVPEPVRATPVVAVPASTDHAPNRSGGSRPPIGGQLQPYRVGNDVRRGLADALDRAARLVRG